MSVYSDAVGLVEHAGSGRLLERKRAGNNTWAVRGSDGAISIRLHQTDVVKIEPGGLVTLNSGGWRTVTTKARMGEFAPGIRIGQARGVWTVYGLASGDQTYSEGFQYWGDTLEAVTPKALGDAEVERARARRILRGTLGHWLRAMPAEDREKVADAFESGNFLGDCFYCSMRDQDGVTMGDLGKSDHLELHVEEGYYVPSMFANALVEKWGLERAGVHAAHMAWQFRRGVRLDAQQVRDVAKYMMARMGQEVV